MELRRPADTATFVTFPIIDADGDTVTGAASLDSEWLAYSDANAPTGYSFRDLTNEATELGTTGIYSLSLTAAELPAASPYVHIQIKTGTAGAKTQHLLINTATWYADVTRWDGVEAGPHPLYPTTAGRALDVSTGGEAGLDWANIGSPTTAQNLSATNIDVDQIVASVSGAVGSVTGAVGSVTADVTLTMGQSLPASPTQSTVGHALVTARQATEYLDADISSRLAPTVAARTLDVNASGGAEIDLDQALAASPTANTVGEALKFAREATEYLDATITSRLASADITLTGGAVNVNQAQTLTIPAATSSTVGQSLVNMRFATDYVDATISSRLALATALSGSPTAQTVGEALKYAREATEYVDETISSRLAPTTSGRTLDVDAAGGAEVGSFQVGAITSGAFGAGAIDASAIGADAIGDSELDMAVASTFADAFLRRNILSGSSGAGGGGDRDVRSALFGLRNRVSIVAGTMTVYGTNDSTSWWTAAVASQAVSEILVEVDPA